MTAAHPQKKHDHPDLDLGRPGASARAEYERLRQQDDRHRVEVFGRYLAPVVKLVAGENSRATNWDKGGRGEERVGRYLSQVVGANGLVLHDRRIPGTAWNIDHLAIVPSGVWVIDTKEYRGKVQQRDLGGWFVSRPALFVNGHNRTNLITGALHQLDRVQQVVRADAPLHATLCFADSEWGLFGRPFTIEGVSVSWARRLADWLNEDGPIEHNVMREVANRLAAAFPHYAPSGTSHSPTGA